MKKLLLSLLLFITLYSCVSDKKNSHLSRKNINGNAKEITETQFNTKKAFGDLKKDDFKYKKISKYNKERNLIEESFYFVEGEVDNVWKLIYGNDGKLTEENLYLPFKLYQKTKFKYNLERAEVNSNLFSFNATYTYDEFGEFLHKDTFVYNVNGELTEMSTGGEKGVTYGDGIIKYKYDSYGNIIEACNYSKNGELWRCLEHKYDENGNIIESYNDNVGFENGDFNFSLTDKKFKYYKFDKKNNWILRRDIFNDKILITEREIEYY